MYSAEITFDAELAKKAGLNEAIMVSILDSLLQTEGVICNGIKWVALSYERLHELVPFMSLMTIRRTIYSLEKQGLIRTIKKQCKKWYTLQNDRNDHFIKETLEQNQLTEKSDQSEQETCLDQNEHYGKSPAISDFTHAVQNEQPYNNNCRKINLKDQDHLKPDKANLTEETTTDKDNTLDQDPADQNGLSLQEIKNLLSDYDIEISWNKRAWQALKQLAALTRDEILKLAKRLFSLQCAGVIKNPAGLLVAKPAEIIRAFFEGTLYPSHTVEYKRSEYFPLYVYAV